MYRAPLLPATCSPEQCRARLVGANPVSVCLPHFEENEEKNRQIPAKLEETVTYSNLANGNWFSVVHHLIAAEMKNAEEKPLNVSSLILHGSVSLLRTLALKLSAARQFTVGLRMRKKID